jgi:hypothetical protein
MCCISAIEFSMKILLRNKMLSSNSLNSWNLKIKKKLDSQKIEIFKKNYSNFSQVEKISCKNFEKMCFWAFF